MKIKILVAVAHILLGFCSAFAAEPELGKEQTVDLFQAMNRGDIEVKFIPKSEKQANILITNNRSEPLSIRLPDAFAASPVLAQFGLPGGGGPAGGAGGAAFGPGAAGGGGQSVGGGFNGGGQNGAGPGMGIPGLLRVAPEKTRKLTGTTVCLEFGKREPNPKMQYRILPIGQYTDDQRVVELCRQLGSGEVSQQVAQAAAWHLENHLSWERLAKINRLQSRYLGHVPLFSRTVLDKANALIPTLTISSQSQATEPYDSLSDAR